MNIDEFLRIFPVRAPNLMWLLGAGASASAGIPTAGNLIWQFKRTLFCTKQRISVKRYEDLSSITIRQLLQRYFDTQGTFPPENSLEEYPAYFEATYPDPSDRRSVLESYMAGVKPSYGHLVLAALMIMGKIRIVWTPNFDRVIEDAAAQMFGSTSRFVTATLDNPQTALQSLNEGRWPLIGKMHGDFQSRRLKNTSEELQSQDFQIRRAFTESCRRYGLIVVGYSGRDQSIMAALEEAIDGGHGYPGGLFWFQRVDSPLFPAVPALLEKAIGAGVRAELIAVETFDELLGDIIKQFEKVPPDLETMAHV
jgi:NAD-dependent SIR2 family protein deacetylase